MSRGKRYLTLPRVQRELGLSPAQVNALVASGELPAFEVLGQWRVERAMLDLFVERRYATSTPAPAPETPPGPEAPLTVAVEAPRGACLSPQQRVILRLVGDGMSNAEIAAALCLEVSTVKTHVSRLLQRFGVRDREQLIAYAWRTGLVGPSGAA